jgi:hypothetical protein
LNIQQLHVSIASGVVLLYFDFCFLIVGDSFDCLHEFVYRISPLELAIVFTVGLELHLVMSVRHLTDEKLLVHREFLVAHHLIVIGNLVKKY